MSKSKMIREAFRSLEKFDVNDENGLKVAFKNFCEKLGFSLPESPDQVPDIENKAAPALDTLDFEEISSYFDD